jgi:hypothetical protein
MDILNWIYLVKKKLVKQQLQSPDDLVILGTNVTYEKRGDKYLSYGMSVSDFAQAIGAGQETIGYYTMDVPTSTTVNITTKKGIIKVSGADTVFTTALGPFGAVLTFELGLAGITTSTKCYVQFTTAYAVVNIKDDAKPYIIGQTAIPGSYKANIYDLAPAVAGNTNQFTGDFLVYYELQITA